MGTIAVKPYLASVDGPDPSLPFHPTMVHPMTGAPLQAIMRRKDGRLVWPVMGGSQPFGDPAAGVAAQQNPGLPGQPMGQTPGLAQIPVLGGGQVVAPQQQANGGNPYGQQMQQPQQQVPFVGQYGQPPQGGQPQYPIAGQQPPPQFPFQVPSPLQVAMQHSQPQNGQQPQGQPGQGGQQQNGQQNQNGQGQNGQGQQAQSGQGGQQNNGTWDRPYPQGVAVEQMTVEQQRDYWKYHSRKNEAEKNRYGDYDQIKTAYEQLRAATATEWQRAEMAAEQRGRQAATQQAAAQLVQFAFQTAASGRTTPEAISAQLSVLDPTRFMHNGQVNLDAVQHYVNVTWPQPQGQPQQQSLWMQPGQPGVPTPGQPATTYLQPGQPGYAQQPTFGPVGQPGQPAYGQPAYGQQPGQVPGYTGPGQGITYPPPAVPGVPQHYPPTQQQQAPPQHVVQPAGMAGLPSLTPGVRPVTDFGQGAGATNPQSGLQAGAAVAAARHGGKTRSAQLAQSNGRG